MAVVVVEEIGANAETVWGFVGNFGGLARWSPYLKSCTWEGEGIGAVRRIRSLQDVEIVERIEAYDPEGRSLTYAILAMDPPSPSVGMVCAIDLKPLGAARTQIRWAAELPQTVAVPEALEKMVADAFRMRIGALRQAAEAAAQT